MWTDTDNTSIRRAFFFRFNQMLTTKTESEDKLHVIAVTNCLAGNPEVLLLLVGLQKRRRAKVI